MARHHRLTLPAPCYSIKLIELVERRPDKAEETYSLHLVDPRAEGGMRLLKSRTTLAPVLLPPPPADFEVIE